MEIKQLNEFNQRMEDTLALALKEVERLKQQFQQLKQKMLPTKTEQKDSKIGPSNCQQVQENRVHPVLSSVAKGSATVAQLSSIV